MSQSVAYRAKRDLIAQWLWDFCEEDESVAFAKYQPDAADLIKYVTANGFEIRRQGLEKRLRTLSARLDAFANEAVHHGDMTPAGAVKLRAIIGADQ